FAAELLMLGQIEIATRGDALQLLRPKREFEKNINRGFGIVREILLFRPVEIQRAAIQADAFVPFDALLHPVTVPDFPAPVGLRRGKVRIVRDSGNGTGSLLHDFIGLDEELQFHLLKLARAESEIARIDFVAEGLAYLPNA